MTRKFKLITALFPALIISGGAHAYAFTTAGGTLGVAEPTADIATCNATETQPDWNSVLDDLASDNKTFGEVPNGPLFEVTPNAAYSGDLGANVYLVDTANLTKAYHYFNMKLYLSGSEEAGETPNYQVITLQNGVATFSIEDSVSDNYTLSVTGGDYTLNSREPNEWEAGWTVTPELYCEARQR